MYTLDHHQPFVFLAFSVTICWLATATRPVRFYFHSSSLLPYRSTPFGFACCESYKWACPIKASRCPPLATTCVDRVHSNLVHIGHLPQSLTKPHVLKLGITATVCKNCRARLPAIRCMQLFSVRCRLLCMNEFAFHSVLSCPDHHMLATTQGCAGGGAWRQLSNIYTTRLPCKPQQGFRTVVFILTHARIIWYQARTNTF